MGNASTLETDMMKKAMSDFLKSFLIKPHIVKVKCGESPKTDYYYEVEIILESAEYLQALRFSESLHSFCLFWRMPIHGEHLTLPDQQ